MTRQSIMLRGAIVLCALAVALAGCGGGGDNIGTSASSSSGGAVTGIAMPSSVSVVSANNAN